jgi:hypothetical protein
MLNHAVGRSAPAWNALFCSQEHVRAKTRENLRQEARPWQSRAVRQEKPDRGPGGTPRGRERLLLQPEGAQQSRRQHRGCPRKSDYELFKCSKVNIRYWSWCYRGCWHQTCPPIVTRHGVWIQPHSRSQTEAHNSYFLSLPRRIAIG